MGYSLVIALFCVAGRVFGQLLMKTSANRFALNGLSDMQGLLILAAAIVIYAVQTLAWVCALRTSELGKIYPIFGLAFILVPLFSLIFFGERLTISYWIGAGLIVAGVILTVKK